MDYVLISHNHRDHLDLRSLRGIFRAHPGARALLPLRTGKLLRKVTGNVREAGWYQQFDTDDRGIDIYFLPSVHWCMRRPGDRDHMLWGSFVIRAGSRTIYFAGDTGRGSHFREISNMFPGIDYALLPIGAYKPDYVMEHHHLSPREALNAFATLGAGEMIPMHYAPTTCPTSQ